MSFESWENEKGSPWKAETISNLCIKEIKECLLFKRVTPVAAAAGSPALMSLPCLALVFDIGTAPSPKCWKAICLSHPATCDVGLEVTFLLWWVVTLLQQTPLEPLISGLGSSQESLEHEAGSRVTPRLCLLRLVGPALGSSWDVRNFGTIFMQDEKQNSNFPVIWQLTSSFSSSLNRVDQLDFTTR